MKNNKLKYSLIIFGIGFSIVQIVTMVQRINYRIERTVKQEVAQEVAEQKQEVKIEEIRVIAIEQRWVEPIENASKEFGVDPLLIYGIANAESGMGKYFFNEYDKDNCHNLWGLKGGATASRIAKGESYIRCFNDEVAGARTIAKTLRLYYLDEGRDTPEKIVSKWVGSKHTKHHDTWVANVNKILASK